VAFAPAYLGCALRYPSAIDALLADANARAAHRQYLVELSLDFAVPVERRDASSCKMAEATL